MKIRSRSCLAGKTPFGLMRDLDDRGHLIIDPDTAPVIRKIYDLALDGWGCVRIGKQLMEDRVPITKVKGNSAVCHNKGVGRGCIEPTD